MSIQQSLHNPPDPSFSLCVCLSFSSLFYPGLQTQAGKSQQWNTDKKRYSPKSVGSNYCRWKNKHNLEHYANNNLFPQRKLKQKKWSCKVPLLATAVGNQESLDELHWERNMVFPSPLQRMEIIVRENALVAKEMTSLWIKDDCSSFHDKRPHKSCW